MKTKQVQLIPLLKACQNYVSSISSQPSRMATAHTTLVGPPDLKLPDLKLPVTSQPPLPKLQLKNQPAYTAPKVGKFKVPRSFGNPCHDLFFNLEYDTPANCKYLNQLLPLAWSYDPITTLKIICNLLDSRGRRDLFHTAASWLHQNHPKTLARNVVPFADIWHFKHILEVLHGVLDVNAKRKTDYRLSDYRCDYVTLIQKKIGNKRKEMIAMARKAVELYERDPDYRLLHEQVSDLYAECLKSDMQNLKKYEQQKMDSNNLNDPDHSFELELTRAAKWCPSVDSFFDRATLLCESIARKVFPREESSVEEEEADYALRVQERLMNEVLEPLREFMDKSEWEDSRRVGREDLVKKYLKDVEAGGESVIEAGAMLPHEIILFVHHDRNFAQLAERQWKAMVEEIYLKQGKLKNCLAVCNVSGSMCEFPMNVSLGLGLLVSELSEEPWKGKVITFSRNPQLLSIQGDDLKSKCAFMRRMDNQDWDGETDFQKVFDLILEVAVNENLKPEKMIKRLFVFTTYQDFDDACGGSWKTDYEAIQRKFEEKGYGDVVPRIVFWDLNDDDPIASARPAQLGVATISGYDRNLVEYFLDNNGELGPDQLMEANIKRYQSVAVVD